MLLPEQSWKLPHTVEYRTLFHHSFYSFYWNWSKVLCNAKLISIRKFKNLPDFIPTQSLYVRKNYDVTMTPTHWHTQSVYGPLSFGAHVLNEWSLIKSSTGHEPTKIVNLKLSFRVSLRLLSNSCLLFQLSAPLKISSSVSACGCSQTLVFCFSMWLFSSSRC